MGLFDDVVGSVLGGGQTQQAPNPLGALLSGLAAGDQTQGGLLSAAMSMLQQNGGLSGVLEMFRRNGMAQQVESWISTGANAGISAEQIQQVFGGSGLGNVASQLGLSQGQASSAMAQILPELINQLTPRGHVPEDHGNLIAQGLDLLRRRGH